MLRSLNEKELKELGRLRGEGRFSHSIPPLDQIKVEYQREGTQLKGQGAKPPAFTIAVVTWQEKGHPGPFQDGDECPTPVRVGVSFRSKEDENTERGELLALIRALMASPVGSYNQ